MRRYPSPPGFCCQKRGIWLAAPAIFWVHRTRRIADTLVSERFRPANRLFVIPNPYLGLLTSHTSKTGIEMTYAY
ncbi:MAG TPA: hypothetical protein PKL76_19135, partial [Phycisphaerae bacterium]|nr:hypothetical protein [Phycisphaerae bacterium]